MASVAATIDYDNTGDDPTKRAPLVLGGEDYASITDRVAGVSEYPTTPFAWYVAFGVASTFTMIFFACIGWLIYKGVGVWGNNSPVFWGWPIVNFVFWVGIGHAGTLISAILFLFRQHWRTSINRMAEAMTIFAVACAGIFPGVHIGRIWFVYWLAPYPNSLAMWPQFRSPLLWDVFAISTYATVSILFWYLGMVPDLATYRDRAKHPLRKTAFSLLSLGWTGSARHWHRYERAYLLLAALATPLVLSVHSVVSFDFAVSQIPGWHTTIFPPYFVAGAIFSGFAMVITLMVPARRIMKLENLVTARHLDNINKIILATSLMVGLAYATELFMAWYSGVEYEQFAFANRASGPIAWAYWTMVTCNVLIPQLLWFKFFRTNEIAMVCIAICVNIGMWFERFVIIVTSLTRDFIPSSWGYFTPTAIDVLMLLGSFGLFLTLFLLFCRLLPVIAMAEVKGVVPSEDGH